MTASPMFSYSLSIDSMPDTLLSTLRRDHIRGDTAIELADSNVHGRYYRGNAHRYSGQNYRFPANVFGYGSFVK